jgi:F-type H+-transporting ATPase subunit alpha
MQYKPIPVEIQSAILWAVQNKLVDDVDPEKIKDFQDKLSDYLTSRKPEVVEQIRKKGAFDDELNSLLKAAITEFKQTYR